MCSLLGVQKPPSILKKSYEMEITYDQLSYVIDEDSMSQQNITVTDIVIFIGILP